MPSTERRPRRIDVKLPPSGGGSTADAATTEPVPPSIPQPSPPSGLIVKGAPFLINSAVTPQAGANLEWRAPQGLSPEGYTYQWATDSGFTTPTSRAVPRGRTTAGVDGLPVATLIYFRVAAVLRGVQSAWSNTASATTPADTTPPGPPTDVSVAFATDGTLEVRATPPTSPNYKHIRVEVRNAADAVELDRDIFTAGVWRWTPARNRQQSGGSTWTTSVTVRLYAVSWGNVDSTVVSEAATSAAPDTPAGLASSWASDDGTAGADLLVTHTAVIGLSYFLSIDSLEREIFTGRYPYPFTLNQSEHSGTADAVLSLSLVARNQIGQSSTAATLTATNAAPPAPSAVDLILLFSGFRADVTATKPRDFLTYRYRIIQTSPSASDVTVDDVEAFLYYATPTNATYQVGVKAVDMFGQESAEELSATLAVDALTIETLRASTIYSDSAGNAPATLKAALADGTLTGGTAIVYTDPASGYNWTQAERALIDRTETITISGTTATSFFYVATSVDGAAWSWFAGPLTDGRKLAAVADEAAAQSNGVLFSALSDGRCELPAITELRFVRLYHGMPGASGGAYALREFYPRRVVETDDLRAEAVRAINIAAGAVTTDKMTIPGTASLDATLRLIAFRVPVSLDTGSGIYQGTGTFASPTTGLKIYNDSGIGRLATYNTGVEQVALDTDGRLKAGGGNVVLDADGLSIVASTSATPNVLNSITWEQGGEEVAQIFGYNSSGTHFLRIAAPDTATKYGQIQIASEGKNGVGGATVNMLGGDGAFVPSTISLGADLINVTGPIETNSTISVTTSATPAAALAVNDAVTNASTRVLNLTHNSTGTPAAGFGASIRFGLESTTTADTLAAEIITSWVTATHASRAGRLTLQVFDSAGAREGLRVEASGSAPQIGFLGAAAVARPTVTGSRGGNAALASLCTALANLGLITNSTS